MHEDRSADALDGPGSSAQEADVEFAVAAAADRRAMKVVGLGAPVSVRIRLEACEVQLIADALLEQIVIDETTQAEARAGLIGEDPHDQARRDRLDELRRMLKEIERERGGPPEAFEVVWPTVLAHDVLQGAFGQAAERLRETLTHREDTTVMRDALNVLAALLDTCEAFRAVDSGGLQDVAL